MELDLAALGLTDIIRLQNQLSQELSRRFERSLALAFTDIVGSTAYFARFGDESGRALQQLHHDLLQAAITPHGGRIVDTAGDGAFTVFPDVEAALEGLVAFLLRVSAANVTRGREHQLVLRLGVHFGSVLTDGTVVTGDAVNLCSRIASTAEVGEIRLSKSALREASNLVRVRCRPLAPVTVKGVAEPLHLFRFDWRDDHKLPASVVVRESGAVLALPRQDTISFGRLRVNDGMPANDVVIELDNKQLEQAVSRWHFELRRRPDGYVLRPVSAQATEVDGRPVDKGTEVPVRPGTLVRLSKVVTLEFRASPEAQAFNADATIAPPGR